MKALILDIEANGFLEDVTKVHCICIKEYNLELPPTIRFRIDFRTDDIILVGHNIIEYDLPVLKKIFGFEHKGLVIDTLLMSRYLWPDRPGSKRPHSLEEWGNRLKFPKGNFNDFSKYSMEMAEYCCNDVLLTEKVLTTLLNEQQINENLIKRYNEKT